MNAPAKIKIVNILEAKTHLSRLIQSVESGDQAEIIIARNGKPVGKLVPYVAKKPDVSKRIGIAKGQFIFDTEASDALDEEIADLFYNGKLWPDEE